MEAPGQGRWRPWSWRGAQRSWQVTSGSGWLTPRWVKDAVQGLGACTAPFAPSSASPGGCAFSFAPQCSPAGLWVSVSSPGSPDPPRLPRPLGTRDSRRLSDALQCLRALPRFAASRVSPSLLPWGGVSFPGRGGRALPPRGQGFGGRCLRCLTPPTKHPAGHATFTAEGLLPHCLAIRPPSAQVSPPRGSGNSRLRPLHGGTHAWPVS